MTQDQFLAAWHMLIARTVILMRSLKAYGRSCEDRDDPWELWRDVGGEG